MRAAVLAVAAALLWGGARAGRVWWRDRRRLRRIDASLRELRRAREAGRLRPETAAVLEKELGVLRRSCPGGGEGR